MLSYGDVTTNPRTFHVYVKLPWNFRHFLSSCDDLPGQLPHVVITAAKLLQYPEGLWQPRLTGLFKDHFQLINLYVKTLYLTAVAIHFPSAGLTLTQGRSETCGRPGQINNLVPLKPKFFKLFRPRTGLIYILKECVQNGEYCRSNSFTCGNPSFLAPYFPLFQRRLRVPYRLEPRPAVWLARPLFRPSFHM